MFRHIVWSNLDIFASGDFRWVVICNEYGLLTKKKRVTHFYGEVREVVEKRLDMRY